MDIGAAEDPENEMDPEFVPKWLQKIDNASAEERSWRKEGEKIGEVYTPKDCKKASYYNTLYSNVDVLLPVLYSATPKADVRRRIGATDPVAKYGSRVIERCIEHQLSEYDFDYVIQLAVLDTLLPGRGILRVGHTPVIAKKMDMYGNGYEEKVGEFAECDYVKWQDFRRSPGKIWNDVTWIAFRAYPDEEDIEAQFGEEIASKLSYTVVANQSDENKKQDQYATSNRAIVWEIWDKKTGKVVIVAESYKDAPLAIMDPPTKFNDFWPIPRPMQFIMRTDSLIPYPEYQQYREQANLLASLSERIARISRALKVRGIYDSTMKDLERLFEAGDNEMLPADQVAAMYEKGGIEKMVWLLPIQDLAAALNYLYQQREQTKAVIYEISGVSDILRGESRASETLGAQQIKVQYANTRLKRRQKEIQRFIRDLFRLMAEVIAENFDPETLAKIANLNVEEMQKEGVNPLDVLKTLRDGEMRDFKIDVQSDSMVALEDQEAQTQLTSFLQGMNQFFTMVTPLIQSGVMPVEVAKTILIQIGRKFKLGDEFEGALEALQPPPPKEDPMVAIKKEEVANEAKRNDIEAANNAQKNDIARVEVMHDVVKSGAEGQANKKLDNGQKE